MMDEAPTVVWHHVTIVYTSDGRQKKLSVYSINPHLSVSRLVIKVNYEAKAQAKTFLSKPRRSSRRPHNYLKVNIKAKCDS